MARAISFFVVQRLLFCKSFQSVLYARQADENQSESRLGQNIAGVVEQCGQHQLQIFADAANVADEKQHTRKLMKAKPGAYCEDITFVQAMLTIAEDARKAQGAKGERVIQKHLQRMHGKGLQHKLEAAVGYACEDALLCAVGETYQADDEHTAQGDAATVGEAGELDKGTDDGGKSDCQTGKGQRPCV